MASSHSPARSWARARSRSSAQEGVRLAVSVVTRRRSKTGRGGRGTAPDAKTACYRSSTALGAVREAGTARRRGVGRCYGPRGGALGAPAAAADGDQDPESRKRGAQGELGHGVLRSV